MKSKRILITVFVPLALLLVAVVGLTHAQGPESPASRAPQAHLGLEALTPVSTSFTYQGQLELDGEPVNEACEIAFRLYNDAIADSQVSAPITETVVISDGLFTQPLDFGADAFTGEARWLGVEVMCPGDGAFTDLGRQALTATPYALYASAAGNADLLGGQPASAFWTTGGNAGTNPATNFLGTTDETSFTLAVSGTTALRLGPAVGTPNIIGGYSGNSVAPGVVGATIGGGGQSNNLNQVTADYAVIAGGDENTIYGRYGTIGGGGEHTVGGFAATVGGGASNVVLPSYATIAGGRNNTITGTAGASVIGGGRGNVIAGTANFATIPGGRSNRAEGTFSFAAGRRAQALYDGDFVWADSTDADFAATAPDQFVVRATGGVGFATGGAGFEIDGDTAWHAGNDGSGSGLDADLLDGQHATVFLTREAFENTDLENMVTNASFESFSAGVDTNPDDWSSLGAEDPPNTSVGRTGSGYHGDYAVEVSDATPSIRFCIQQQIYADSDLPGYFHGQTLVLSVWARKAEVSGVSIGEIAISDGVARSATSLQDDITWHSVVVTHQVASTATQLTVELCPTGEGTADAGTYQFDAVMLTRGTFEPLFALGLLDVLASEDVTVDTLSVKGDAQLASNLVVGGDLQVIGNYIQFPTITGSAPPSADCDEAVEAGRIVVRTDGATNLYICTGTSGWVGK